jgi:hypothetical protein
MPYAVLNSEQTGTDVDRLDELIQAAEREKRDLVMEHLHSARAYLLGAMPGEYAASLQDTLESANQIKDKDLRHRLQETVQGLLGEVKAASCARQKWQHRTHPRPHTPFPFEVSGFLGQYFGRSDLSFGKFYPREHIVAAFPSIRLARQAEEALLQAGFSGDEVALVPGHEMLKFLAEIQLHRGLVGTLMAGVSRHLGTEQVFVDNDVQWARLGAAFLIAYAPDFREADFVRRLIAPFKPLEVERYLRFGVHSLV